ncbi:MAG: YdeI/OmpD-associated family protein [Winogradskyella sp.]|uniref:YdeI/OmpD-associated family protein n=1 Tax=Winogradskyella sp. TaxID=1883156 RepID=UPI0017DD061C|nr:YdeI/OmpD-associated family protein [Winogradskyella sp.]
MLKSKPFEISLSNKMRIVLPNEHILDFITRNEKRIRVVTKFEKKSIEFYAALKKDKTGLYYIYFSKAKQKELGIFQNDYFTLQIFEDTSKYGVEMSEELQAVLLTDFEAFQIFENLTPGRKRSLIYAISRYKSPQTRVDKALILTQNLKKGIKDPKLWLKA